MSSHANPLISGPLTAAIFRLAGPMFISAILQNAQNLIDLFWVGRLGSESVAALAVSGSILFLLWPLVMGMSVGTVALVSRHTGAGRSELASAAAGQSLVLAVVVGAVTGAIGLLGMNWLLRLMDVPSEVFGLACGYLGVSLLGYISVFILILAGSALQGVGQATLPMTAMIIANIVNLALDPVLIFGLLGFPALGVRGAALATVVAQAVGCVILIRALVRGVPLLRLRWCDLRLRLRMIFDLFRIGIFSSAQMLARSLMGFAIFRLVARYGTPALAGYGIGMRFHQVILLPCFALGNATAAIVGQNLGAKQPARAERAAWLASGIGALINFVAAGIMMIFAASMTRAFNSDPEVVSISASYLRLVSPFYVFAAFGIVLGRGMNGAGDTIPTMIITILTLWGVQVPLAYFFAYLFTTPTMGIWWAIAVTNLVNGFLTAAWFATGRWKLIKIGPGHDPALDVAEAG